MLDARARAVQLPAWNEALGLPRPWDQQWSLRIQQVLAFEWTCSSTTTSSTGRSSSRRKVAELVEGARAEIDRVQELGGAVAAVESRLHEVGSSWPSTRAPPPDRVRRGVIVGRQPLREHRADPLTADLDAAIQTVDAGVEAAAVGAVVAWRERATRTASAAEAALDRLRADAGDGREPHAGRARVRPRRR